MPGCLKLSACKQTDPAVQLFVHLTTCGQRRKDLKLSSVRRQSKEAFLWELQAAMLTL